MEFVDGRVDGVERYGRFDTGGKMVLNDNKDIRNILPDDQLKSTIIDTLKDIITLLSKHCGPDSQYAMIITGSGNSDFEPNIFTKDGIKILTHLEYVSPIQTYVKELIAYIGRRVDSAAKDGTTTSMLFAANFLLELCDKFNASDSYTLDTQDDDTSTNSIIQYSDEIVNILKSTTTQDLDRLYLIYMNKVLKALDTQLKYTIDTFIEDYEVRPDVAAGIIAFIQALSSSGGNLNLAKVNFELFKNTPKELWNRITMVQSTIETKTPYSVQYQESQYKLHCNMLTEIRNTDLGTRYVDHDVILFAYPDAIAVGTVVLDRVIDWIDSVDEDKAVAILAQAIDAQLITYIEKKNATRVKPITAYANLEKVKYGSDSWDIMAINAMAGKYSYSDRNESIRPIDIDRHCILVKRLEMNFNYLELFDFYPVTDELSNLHPYYTDPQAFKPYTELIQNINKIIERDAAAHVHNNQLIDSAYRVFTQMVCRRVPKLVIGGSTHENIANMVVAQDVIGATMSSITQGFIPGGILSVFTVLNTLDDIDEDCDTPHDSIIINTLHRIFISTLGNIIDTIYIPELLMRYYYINECNTIANMLSTAVGNDYNKYINGCALRNVFKNDPMNSDIYTFFNENIESVVENFQTYINSLLNTDNNTTEKESIIDRLMEFDKNTIAIRSKYPPIQPYTVYSELFHRVGELLIRVAKTGTIMVPGGVFLNIEEVDY